MKIRSKFILNLLNNLPNKCKTPLDAIITKMLETSKYIDESTLIYDEDNEYNYDKEHYHNWECNPSKINEIKTIKNNEYNENNDIELIKILGNKELPNVECIKGDIQLGKRLHACILMWLSIYIYERPVLYLFRPLNIDKEQLQDDIDGTEPWNFNMEWVKNIFNEDIDNNRKYYDYRLPSLTDIKDKKVAHKMSDKEYIRNPKMIYMALMNPTDLETLNKKFYEYILEYSEKINITLIIDESDLLSPSAENCNNISEQDTKNSKSEKLISRLIHKVAHTINITGTAHPFFWNYTTALSGEQKTFIPVNKVFVMKRHNDYYGFMKKNINFSSKDKENLPIIKEWWLKGKGVSKEDKYDVIKDYNLNIKSIINSIVKRQNSYNSFLISEEKIQNNQTKLAEKIITDFHSLFCVVFHGKKGKNGLPTGLRLYFPKKIYNLDIETELQQVVIFEKRLDKIGGLKGSPTSDNNKEYYDEYKYYDINMKSKEFNIKMVYKVLAMLFKKIKSNKTVITITGKYGERGYSFTSDYYNKDNKYVLHLTDQYFVSHTSYNCTDIFQRGRIQGKYTDNPNLIFWTTNELVEIINHYVDFITKIETKIMSLPRGHEYIRNLCEIYLFHKEFIKTLGRSKQRKNLESKCIKYDRKNNAMIYSFPPNLNSEKYEEYFSEWCKEQNIEFNGFINRLEISEKKHYIKKYGVNDFIINQFYNLSESDTKKKLSEINQKYYPREKDNDGNIICCLANENKKKWKYQELEKTLKSYSNKSTHGIHNGLKSNNQYATRIWTGYDENNSVKQILKIGTILNNKILQKSDINILEKQNYIETDDNKILYSQLNYKYINDNFFEYEFEDDEEIKDNDEFSLSKDDIETIKNNSYFFFTADGFVYHHDINKSIKKVKLEIKSEIEQFRNNDIINSILTFKKECIKEIEGSKRICIKKLMEVFNTWCKKYSIKEYKILRIFREDFEKITNLKRSKTNTLGYKIELKI